MSTGVLNPDNPCMFILETAIEFQKKHGRKPKAIRISKKLERVIKDWSGRQSFVKTNRISGRLEIYGFQCSVDAGLKGITALPAV